MFYRLKSDPLPSQFYYTHQSSQLWSTISLEDEIFRRDGTPTNIYDNLGQKHSFINSLNYPVGNEYKPDIGPYIRSDNIAKRKHSSSKPYHPIFGQWYGYCYTHDSYATEPVISLCFRGTGDYLFNASGILPKGSYSIDGRLNWRGYNDIQVAFSMSYEHNVSYFTGNLESEDTLIGYWGFDKSLSRENASGSQISSTMAFCYNLCVTTSS
ncbi:hypothetical protein C8Q75DRAFT_457502 [Abortiporus biennis]|nr:hypothetical protein C8Q75DRAFT_457502 [Abortiporus biennis]